MAKKRYINTKFWDDNYITNLDPIEKLMFLYFITNPLTDICGVYEIPLRRMAFDTGIDKDMIIKILERFKNDDKIYYIDGWIYVKNFSKNQIINDSVQKGISRSISVVPKEILDEIDKLGQRIERTNQTYYEQKQIPDGQRKRIFERDGRFCQKCKTTENLEIDHIIPVFQGGKNEDKNLRVLCQKCNLDYYKEKNTELDRLGQSVADCDIPKPKPKPKLEPELNNSKQSLPVNDILDEFYEFNPTLSYGNKTQRSATEELLKKYGLEQLKVMIKQYRAIMSNKFCPIATTPIAFKNKLGDIIAFINKEKSNSRFIDLDE